MERFIYNYIVYNYMQTTIQIDERTLELLKKLKKELNVPSYNKAIVEMAIERTKKESMAGALKRYKGKETLKEILKDLRNKNDRF